MFLTDEQWKVLKPILEPPQTPRRGRPWKDGRAVFEALDSSPKCNMGIEAGWGEKDCLGGTWNGGGAMNYKQLSMEERSTLALLRAQGYGVVEIAKVLGRHRVTIWREVGRYRAERAQEHALSARCSAPRSAAPPARCAPRALSCRYFIAILLPQSPHNQDLLLPPTSKNSVLHLLCEFARHPDNLQQTHRQQPQRAVVRKRTKHSRLSPATQGPTFADSGCVSGGARGVPR